MLRMLPDVMQRPQGLSLSSHSKQWNMKSVMSLLHSRQQSSCLKVVPFLMTVELFGSHSTMESGIATSVMHFSLLEKTKA